MNKSKTKYFEFLFIFEDFLFFYILSTVVYRHMCTFLTLCYYKLRST
jgi:hypothetical protein